METMDNIDIQATPQEILLNATKMANDSKDIVEVVLERVVLTGTHAQKFLRLYAVLSASYNLEKEEVIRYLIYQGMKNEINKLSEMYENVKGIKNAR